MPRFTPAGRDLLEALWSHWRAVGYFNIERLMAARLIFIRNVSYVVLVPLGPSFRAGSPTSKRPVQARCSEKLERQDEKPRRSAPLWNARDLCMKQAYSAVACCKSSQCGTLLRAAWAQVLC